jgi:hypothetical protein
MIPGDREDGLMVPCGNFLSAPSIAAQLHRFLVIAHSALQFNLRIRNESGPLPLGYAQRH